MAQFVHWDDNLHIFDNPLTQTTSPSVILSIFQSVVNKTYIPLTILSFNIEHFFFGFNPFVYHFDNFILHIFICLFIYALISQMGLERRVAFLAAVLFGIHPMHVESVAWATQRKDVLYTLFYILSLSQYWKYLIHRRNRFYIISILFGFLSILAKPMALSLPLTLLLFDWYYQGRIIKQALLNKIPYLLVIVPVAWITYHLNARVPFTDQSQSFLIWAWSATFYIKKFFTPFVLLPIYELPQPVSILNLSYISSILIFAVAPFALFRFRKDRLFLFGCMFYALSTFFLWRYDDTIDVTIVGDRFMYLPSLGICLWLAHTVETKIKDGRLFSKMIPIILVIMAALTFQQCRIWHDDISLWNHEIKYEQHSALSYNSRGVALSKRNDNKHALEDITKAIELKPDYTLAYYNRGHIFAKAGKLDLAFDDYNAALTFNPKHVKSLLERGIIHSRKKEYSEALADFDAAENLEPKNANVFNNRGIVYKQLGGFQKALEDYNRALELNPGLVLAFVNRANLWKEMNNYQESLKDIHQAQKLGAHINAADLQELESLTGAK